MTNKKLLILVDGSSYLHRAYHALPNLKNAQGEATGAIYGVLNMLRKLLKDYQPDKIAIVFDAKGKNFRHEMFEEYKAHRAPMHDELREQIEPLHNLIRALGFPLISVSGVEADDVIATLTKQAEKANLKVLIVTGDKDFAQLVNEDVTLIDTMKDTKLDRAGVIKKFGVPPERVVDYLALIGDQSDNVPGVTGVGPKTAVNWLKKYGSLDEIVKHANEIDGKVGENLRAHLKELPLAKTLVTTKEDVPLDVTLDDLHQKEGDRALLLESFKRYEFQAWLKELLGKDAATGQNKNSANNNYQTILDEAALDHLIKKLESATEFAIDTETTSLNTLDAKLVGTSFAFKAQEAYYLPLAHDYEGAPKQLDLAKTLAKLKPILEDATKKKIGQNLKYDYKIFKNYNITLANIAFDTMLESYVLNSVSSHHDLDTLALKQLGIQAISFEEVAGKGAKQITFNLVDVARATAYAAEDADLALQLHQNMLPMLEQEKSLLELFHKIEMPLVPVLADMERAGILIDSTLLKKQSDEIAIRLAQIEKTVYTQADEVFNLNSPKQLQEILFNKLKLPILEKTPTGQPSTAESVLQELANDYELPRVILEYRTLSKLKSTYTDALPEQVNAKTGRVHTSFNQAVTATGRLSSTDPNLQNIPIRTEEGRRIRQAFIAPTDCQLIAADYSQIELRIMAHLSNDAGLLKAFGEDGDIHRATAAEVFGIPPKEVTHEQRRRAKAINFGLIYGMSAFGLSKQLGVAREEAQKYVDLYFERYPGVKIYMEESRQKARDNGFVETIFGRRLYVPEINSQNFMRRSGAERAAINAPMQGSASDIMKIAMINLAQKIEKSSLQIKMLLQVHDELVFEVAAKDLVAAKNLIKHEMEHAVQLKVPVLVQVGAGNNWDEAHE